MDEVLLGPGMSDMLTANKNSPAEHASTVTVSFRGGRLNARSLTFDIWSEDVRRKSIAVGLDENPR